MALSKFWLSFKQHIPYTALVLNFKVNYTGTVTLASTIYGINKFNVWLKIRPDH